MAAGIDFADFETPTTAPEYSHVATYNLRLPTKENPLTTTYERFNSFMHVTDYRTAAVPILQSSWLKHHRVKDCSVVNSKEWEHPLKEVEVLWFGPCLKEHTGPVERYGNIKFEMMLIHGLGGMLYEGVRFYFVEVIEFDRKSACRILVTPNVYDDLREYDPYQLGGPWYIDPAGNHFHLTNVLRDGKLVPNTLEIMREDHNHDYLVRNLQVSYVRCTNAPPNVTYVTAQVKPHLLQLVEDSNFSWKDS